jgi:hypothetical protein
VYPGGPSEKAGLRTSDRIVQFNGKPVAKATDLREMIASLEPGKTASLRFLRDGKESSADVELSALPTELPDAKAAQRTAPPPTEAEPKAKQTSVVEIKIPEELNACVALVPRTYRQDVPHGLLVYLPQPGDFNNDAFVQKWEPICEQFDLIVVAPRALLPNMWLPPEVALVRKVMDHMVTNYTVDRTRIVIGGYQASGSMAYLTAFRHRDLVRGLVAIDTGLKESARIPDNDPVERLAIVVAVAEKTEMKARIEAGVEALRELKYPVTVIEQSGEPRELNDQELRNIAVWIDTLDRI